jgi:hypothetical protein
MASDFSYLREHYPQEVTSDQVRQMLHISKRKCAWMLQNGFIRCQDNGKKPRRYTIYLEDAGLNHNTSMSANAGNAQNFEKYLSPLWRPENAANVKGGHGGMDGFCFSAFFDCLRRGGKNVPTDAYDAATWMAITALSEQSIALGGSAVSFPDFTNGEWIRRAPLDCDDFTQPIPEEAEEEKDAAEGNA